MTRMRMSTPLRAVLAAFVAIGVVSFAAAAQGSHPERAWAAFLVNFMYFFGLAQAGIVFSAIQRIVYARWGGPIVRVHEAFGAYLPVAFVLLLVLLFGGVGVLYPWVHEDLPGKAAWLNVPFMRARDVVVVLVLLALSWAYLRLVLQPDLAAAAPAAADLAARRHRLSRLSPIICLLYAAGMAVLAWDLLMSLEPHWYSTMFPVIVFWGGLLNAVAWTILLTVLAGERLGVREHVSVRTWHDLGKLLFAFGVFWAYINYGQLLVIWYGNLPEETGWLWERVAGPWRPVSVAVALLVWFVPFTGLLTRATKTNPRTLVVFATLVAAGLWLERFMMVYPSVLKHAAGALGDGTAHAATAAAGGAQGAAHVIPVVFGFTEVGVTLGFLGLFLLAFFWFAGRFPMVAVRDFLDARGQEGH